MSARAAHAAATRAARARRSRAYRPRPAPSTPSCARTKGLFRDVLQVDTKVVELDQLDNGAEYQDELLTITGQRTVPNVFVKGSHLGGCDDTMKANDSGKLAEMLGL